MARKTGATAGLEREYLFFFKAVCLFRSCVCVVWFCLLLFLFLELCVVIHDTHRSKLRALCSGESLICPVDCVNSLRGPATIFVLCWKERNKQ